MVNQDPATITWSAIARYLDGSNRPRCAAYVRRHDEQLTRIMRDRDEWQLKCAELRERLNKYEPPAPVLSACSYKPSPWSDG
jgi:hypothetical protein